jgi:hypothetical protein
MKGSKVDGAMETERAPTEGCDGEKRAVCRCNTIRVSLLFEKRKTCLLSSALQRCVQSRSLPSCNPVGGHVATSSRLIWSSAYHRHSKAGDTAGCHCDDDDKDCLRYEVRTGCKRESARPLEFSLDGEALCIGRLIRHLPATYNPY